MSGREKVQARLSEVRSFKSGGHSGGGVGTRLGQQTLEHGVWTRGQCKDMDFFFFFCSHWSYQRILRPQGCVCEKRDRGLGEENSDRSKNRSCPNN